MKNSLFSLVMTQDEYKRYSRSKSDFDNDNRDFVWEQTIATSQFVRGVVQRQLIPRDRLQFDLYSNDWGPDHIDVQEYYLRALCAQMDYLFANKQMFEYGSLAYRTTSVNGVQIQGFNPEYIDIKVFEICPIAKILFHELQWIAPSANNPINPSLYRKKESERPHPISENFKAVSLTSQDTTLPLNSFHAEITPTLVANQTDPVFRDVLLSFKFLYNWSGLTANQFESTDGSIRIAQEIANHKIDLTMMHGVYFSDWAEPVNNYIEGDVKVNPVSASQVNFHKTKVATDGSKQISEYDVNLQVNGGLQLQYVNSDRMLDITLHSTNSAGTYLGTFADNTEFTNFINGKTFQVGDYAFVRDFNQTKPTIDIGRAQLTYSGVANPDQQTISMWDNMIFSNIVGVSDITSQDNTVVINGTNVKDLSIQPTITDLTNQINTKATKTTDFQTAITDANKGITQAEYQTLMTELNARDRLVAVYHGWDKSTQPTDFTNVSYCMRNFFKGPNTIFEDKYKTPDYYFIVECHPWLGNASQTTAQHLIDHNKYGMLVRFDQYVNPNNATKWVLLTSPYGIFSEGGDVRNGGFKRENTNNFYLWGAANDWEGWWDYPNSGGTHVSHDIIWTEIRVYKKATI